MNDLPVIIIDSDDERIRDIEALFARKGIPSQSFRRWDSAVDLLEHTPDVPLALVGYDLLIEEEGDAAAAASMQLMMMGVPAILLYNGMHAFDVDMLRDFAHFSSYLEWPVSEADIVTALSGIFPDIARTPNKFRGKRPATGWIKLQEFVIEEAVEPAPNPVIIIDTERERIEGLHDFLSRKGLQTRVFKDWGEALAILEMRDTPLVILGFEAIIEADPEAVLMADGDLLEIGVPAILVYDNMLEFEVSMVQDDCHFASYLAWPATDAEATAAVGGVLPIAGAPPRAQTPPSSRPENAVGAAQKAAPPADNDDGFFDFEELVEEQRDSRQVIEIPSLSGGRLEEVPIPRLLYFLAVQRRTGHLHIKRGSQAFKVALRDGWLIRYPGQERVLSSLQAVFSWDAGEYRFEWDAVEGGKPVPLLEFIYDGITQFSSYNDLLIQISSYQAKYPAYTSLFLGRFKLLSKLKHVCDVAQRCRGNRPLGMILKEAAGQYAVFAPALAFCFHTDAVGLLNASGKAPIGITYSLHHRISDVRAETQRPALLGKTMVGGASADFRTRQATHAQIERMNIDQYTLLAKFEKVQTLLIESDPYEALSLFPGCGRAAVRDAFQRTQRKLPEIGDENYPEPLRITARLVSGALQDIYLLLMAQEKGEAPAFERRSRSLSESAFETELDTIGPIFEKIASIHRAAEAAQKKKAAAKQATEAAEAAEAAAMAKKRLRTARVPPPVLKKRSPQVRRVSSFSRPIVEAEPLDIIPEPLEPVGMPNIPALPIIMSAVEHFEQGNRELQAQRFDSARRHFTIALKGDSDNGLYLAHEAWASYLQNPESQPNVVRKLRKSRRMKGGEEMSFYFLGSIALQNNEFDEATKHFHRCLKDNPDNYEATQKLRLVKMREEQANTKGGLFSKLFNK